MSRITFTAWSAMRCPTPGRWRRSRRRPWRRATTRCAACPRALRAPTTWWTPPRIRCSAATRAATRASSRPWTKRATWRSTPVPPSPPAITAPATAARLRPRATSGAGTSRTALSRTTPTTLPTPRPRQSARPFAATLRGWTHALRRRFWTARRRRARRALPSFLSSISSRTRPSTPRPAACTQNCASPSR